jgi:K+-transporting ATPase ATPase B chain
MTVLTALLVCPDPHTIGGLLSAIGIAGMDRMIQKNVIAMSGRAVEAAGDVDVLLLDKTGTITLGNRQAVAFMPATGVSPETLADAAQLASLADETPEGRSIVVLAKERVRPAGAGRTGLGAHFVRVHRPDPHEWRGPGRPPDPQRGSRRGRGLGQERWRPPAGRCADRVEGIARQGSTPLVVAEGARVLGAIQLKDIVKGGIKERFAELRQMGIKTVMITGDNPLTAAAIAPRLAWTTSWPRRRRSQARADPEHQAAAGWWP